jgi:two-component system response regulator QseB
VEHGEVAPKPTVLIVEDDERIADFMRRGLRASGFTVEWVATGAEALERILAGGVDVQILDLGLPDFDGLVLMQQLNERGASVPTVVVTARSDPKYRNEAASLGVHTYITKPFAFADLVAAVRASAESGTER